MAALRQLLNARGITKETPSEEDQRRNDAKMQAMAYSISSPIPTRLRTSRSEDQGQRPFNPKYNNHPPSAWQQHSLYRGDQADAANAFDHSGDSSRPQLSRSATDDHLHQSLQPYNLGHGRMPSNGVSSYYGEDESPLMSPALNNHLALLPLQPHAQEQHHQPPATQAKHGRRHSKSATADDVHYGADREDNHKEKRKAHKPRQESLRDGSSKPLPDTNSSPDQKTRAMQLIRDRQKSPSLDSGNVRPSPLDPHLPH